MILRRSGSRVFLLVLVAASVMGAPATRARRSAPASELSAPIAVYSYDSADVALSAAPLSQDLAMRELGQLVRLKKAGVRFDYDLIDASLFASGADRAAWPDGPDAWIAKCRAAGIRPGLRFAASSPDIENGRGSLPADLISLQSWYDRGVRLFEFDVTSAPAGKLAKNQVVPGKTVALHHALETFRAKNRDAVLVVVDTSAADLDSSTEPQTPPDSQLTTLRPLAGLGAFGMLSTGPPRPSAMPQASLRRSIDIESDDQVRRLEQSGVPLAQIHSVGFAATPPVVSGFDSQAGSPADRHIPLRNPMGDWQGAFLLSLARGGWIDAVHGSLEAIQSADARWMARAQKLFLTLQAQGHMHSFGSPAGSGQPYGFAGASSRGSVYVVVNPGQTIATLALPPLESNAPLDAGRVQFRDAGFMPRLSGNSITLGPGQMAVVGFGGYAAPAFALGVQQDVIIPSSIEPVDADFQSPAPGALEARFDPPIQGVLRILVWECAPISAAEAAGRRFTLDITQAGRPIPARLAGAAGESAGNSSPSVDPSWAVAEIDVDDLTPGIPLRVRFHANENQPALLEGRAYQVVY